ncbi:MAG: HAMP domain-containing protein [Gemmatimonadetes bacterium]|nr:HAMP domain-containing protein [Gemmatimonadota bacterium]
MTAPRSPSITRAFTATFLAVSLAGLAIIVNAWVTATRIQNQAVAMVETINRVQRLPDAAPLNPQRDAMRDVIADVADDAVQTAATTTVIMVALLLAVGLAFFQIRTRLTVPFAHVVGALERVAAGQYAERLDEHQPDELGMIAREVNRMGAALAWREQMQAYTAQLLTAINAPHGEGGSLPQALDVLAAATGTGSLALYQPSYDTNEWAPTVTRELSARAVSRTAMRELVGDAANVVYFAGDAAEPARRQFAIAAAPAGMVLGPLRSEDKLVGLLVALPLGEFTADHRTALELALPNLAVACERESAHRRLRRLATEVRRTAQRLEAVNAELDQANRMKDQFLSNVSHELRTPLNSIIGFSELLLLPDIGPISDTQRDYIETVARNGRHLLQLINELLDLSKIAAGRFELRREPIVLEDVFREVADSVRAQLEAHRHALVIEPPPEGLRVLADRLRLRQVLLNLLSNAIKFTPDHGQITVRAGRVDGASEARISVTDTGIGIAPADQPKLFREFVQLDASTSRQYEGTGLGLALCKRLVELHGGAIGVESEVGRGSTFWFTLPQVSGPTEAR